MGAVAVGRLAIADGFSDFDIIVDVDEPFPVELLNLRATPQQDHILVDWTTLTETNNKGFFVQRAEGKSEAFRSLGWVDGAGTSFTPIPYQFPDRNVKFNTPYYYRLEQEDLDGKRSFSNVVNAMLTANGLFVLSAYPNPTTGKLQLNYSVGQNCCEMQIEVLDAIGKQLVTQSHSLNEANGTLPLDISNLAAGMYLVKVKINGLEQTLQVIKTTE
jgi:hypothetical protein